MPLSYTEARKFAYYISYGADNHKDVLHDAYIRYWNSTGENLLEAPKSTILNCIRNENTNNYRKEHLYTYQGAPTKWIWFSFNEETDSPKEEERTEEQELADELEFNALIAELKRRSKEYKRLPLEKVIDRMAEAGSVIAEELSIPIKSVWYYRKKIKEIAQSMRDYQPHNPFNGNNTKVIKVVTRKTYDKNPEKYSEFKNDSDLGADENEWYSLYVNEKKEGLLIRETEK